MQPSPADGVAPSHSPAAENNENKDLNIGAAMERNYSSYSQEEVHRHSPTDSERERELMPSFNYQSLPVGLPPLIRDPS